MRRAMWFHPEALVSSHVVGSANSRMHLSLRSWLMSFIIWAHGLHCFTQEFSHWWKWHTLRNVIKAFSRQPRVNISRFVPSALRSVYCHKPWPVLTPYLFSFAGTAAPSGDINRYISLRLLGCSPLILKASSHRSFLIISMAEVFLESSSVTSNLAVALDFKYRRCSNGSPSIIASSSPRKHSSAVFGDVCKAYDRVQTAILLAFFG